MLSNRQQRQLLEDYMYHISDVYWLDRVWTHQNYHKKPNFSFSDVISLFFDDTHYAEQPEDHLGETLLDKEEIVLVRRMVAALETLLTACEDLGLTDAEYLRRPEWPAVHEAAKALHALIVANDAKMASS